MQIKRIVIVVVLLLAAYPITGLIQVMPFIDAAPYTAYEEFMKPIWIFISDNFGEMVIAIATCIVVIRLPEVMYDYQEILRWRQYYFEYLRWKDTPFIAPLMLYYMMSPPDSFSNRTIKQAHSDFYPSVVRNFQDRVAINSAFNSSDPKKRKSAFRVIGSKIMGVILMHVIALGLMLYYAASGTGIVDTFAQSYAKYLIPIVIHIAGYILVIILAIAKTARWSVVDKRLKAYFYEKHLHHEPRILWLNLLPDTDYGLGILKMWKRDCYRRIQLTYDLKERNFPHHANEIIWDNPTIPSNPFPDYLDMSWVHQTEQIESENKAYKAMNENKGRKMGQVIAFNKKRRHI
jgi:hypothetical protein